MLQLWQITAEIEDGQRELSGIHSEMRQLQEDALAMHENAQAQESECSEKVAVANRLSRDLEQREVTKNLSPSKHITSNMIHYKTNMLCCLFQSLACT